MRQMPGQSVFKNLVDRGDVVVGDHEPPEVRDSYSRRFAISLHTDEIQQIENSKKEFWLEIRNLIISDDVIRTMLRVFAPHVTERFGDRLSQIRFKPWVDLVRDKSRFSLGPHSDTPRNVVVFLFYLPENAANKHLGTSVYVPKDPSFSCPGGPHHSRELFNCSYTADYVPNSAIGFFKSDDSFHGVETVSQDNETRNLIQISIQEM